MIIVNRKMIYHKMYQSAVTGYSISYDTIFSLREFTQCRADIRRTDELHRYSNLSYFKVQTDGVHIAHLYFYFYETNTIVLCSLQ